MTQRGLFGIASWAVWSLADAAAISAATWTAGPGAAVAGHAAVVAAGCVWLGLSRRKAPGSGSVLAFGGVFALLNPVVGPAVAGWLLRQRPREATVIAAKPAWVTGNREFGEAAEAPCCGEIETTPLLARLGGSPGGLRGAISRLRRDCSSASLDLLRRIVNAGNVRTQLIAKTAVLTLGESSEAKLRRLRQAHRHRPGDLRTSVWLASALRTSALAGVRGEDESRQDLAEACDLYAAALQGMPRDGEALTGWADCLWRLGRNDELRDAVKRLSGLPGAEDEALRLDCLLHCLEGDWCATQHRLAQAPLDSGGPQLAPSRDFWLRPPPLRHA